MKYIISMFFLSVALCMSMPVFASDDKKDIPRVSDRYCKDDRGTPRCFPEFKERMRAIYGLTDAQTMIDNGTQFRRAFFVDGYGRDVLALTFIRKRGTNPKVEIRVPVDNIRAPIKDIKEKARDINIISADISLKTWEEVIGKGRLFDRDLVTHSKPDAFSICLHSWLVVAEAGDPIRLYHNTIPASQSESEIRHKMQSTCEGGLAIRYSFEMADLAYDALPICQSIAVESFRNKVMVLNACDRSSGDMQSAGLAAKMMRELQLNSRRFRRERHNKLEQLIVHPISGSRKIKLPHHIDNDDQKRLIDALTAGDLYYSNVHGVDADYVVITGSQSQYQEDDYKGLRPVRPIKIFAVRSSSSFQVYKIEAGEFKKPTP